LSDSSKKELDAVQKDYSANKERTVKYVVDKVLDVPIGLTDTQRQALKMGMA